MCIYIYAELVSGVHKGFLLVKGGLAIYALPLCNCNTLGCVVHVRVKHMPHMPTIRPISLLPVSLLTLLESNFLGP